MLVVEDHPLLAEGIRALLSARGAACVGPAHTVEEGRQLVATGGFDLLVVDIALPDGSGLDLVRASAARDIPAIVLTGQPGGAYVREALRAGAQGYVFKGEPPVRLVEALEAVLAGQTFMGRRALDVLSDPRAGSTEPLSPREIEVLRLLASGMTNKEAGSVLHISPRTVETHREHLMDKLGVRTVAGLTRMAILLGYVAVGED